MVCIGRMIEETLCEMGEEEVDGEDTVVVDPEEETIVVDVGLPIDMDKLDEEINEAFEQMA